MTSPAERETATKALATELSRVRQRGISRLNQARGDQKPVVVPQLEALARTYTADQTADRVPLILRLLRDGLDDYAVRNAGEATSVRSLFFDADGRAPGPAGASGLLDSARKTADLYEDQFRKQQRQQFEAFAADLTTFVDRKKSEPQATEDAAVIAAGESGSGPQPAGDVTRPLRKRTVLISLLVGVLIAAAIFTAVRLDRGSRKLPQAGGSATTGSASASGPQLVRFRFDALGSTYSTILNVYPGVKATVADRKANGTFRDGEEVTAVCVTTGRTVTSDPHFGEQARTSDQWVQVQAEEGVLQYATRTYGDLEPAVAKLPACQGVR